MSRAIERDQPIIDLETKNEVQKEQKTDENRKKWIQRLMNSMSDRIREH